MTPSEPPAPALWVPAVTEAPDAPVRAGRRPGALVRGCRPRQMTKNLLVLTAPALAGGMLGELGVLTGAAIAFLTFCAASAAVYLGNDLRDVEVDRRHPTKRLRPIASGALSPRAAGRTSVALVVGSLGLALWWSTALALVLAVYLAVQVAYSAGLKHRPGLDLLVVASGFVLRVVAGGVGAGVELSLPFLTVVGFASLFMVAGKRYSELASLGAAAATRPSLLGYSLRWLRATWVASAVVAVVGYAVAAGGLAPLGTAAAACALLSVPPFVAGILRYASHVQGARAGCPEAVVFGDRALQALGLLWLVPVALAVTLT